MLHQTHERIQLARHSGVCDIVKLTSYEHLIAFSLGTLYNFSSLRNRTGRLDESRRFRLGTNVKIEYVH